MTISSLKNSKQVVSTNEKIFESLLHHYLYNADAEEVARSFWWSIIRIVYTQPDSDFPTEYGL